MAETFVPEWPAPLRVRALQTMRGGGCSPAPWGSFNLGDHVGDAPERVAENRQRLRSLLPGEPFWLQQVHGNLAVDADKSLAMVAADASFTRCAGMVCAVMTADCLPVLFCDRNGTVVAAAHAGWRGLLAGVLEQTLHRMEVQPSEVLAWLGPAIGPLSFEVGAEVRAAFCAESAFAQAAFAPAESGKWLADIYLLARYRLERCGVRSVYGGDACTVSEKSRYFSYRREGVTGRMASLIWLER